MATVVAPAASFRDALPDDAAPSVERAAGGGFREHWPLSVLMVGFPIWWALGLGALIWPVFAVPMAARLLLRRRALRVPRGFGLWCLFLVWMVVSSAGLDRTSVPFAFTWRLTIYGSITVFFLYIFNTPREQLPAARVVGILVGFWFIVVAGGWLGVLAPNGGFASFLQRELPDRWADHEFLSILIHPSFAQVHDVLGYPLGRPKAPFVYTNDWGSVYGLLFPFFIYGWLQSPRSGRRANGLIVLAVSLVPVFISLNRGLWLSLGIALLYASTRPGPMGRLARRALLGVLLLGLGLVLTTSIRSVLEDRIENPHSNRGRSFLYGEALELTARSPIIGYGAPQPYEAADRIVPAIGTQGQLWLVIVSQGFVGAGLFVAFFVRMAWSTRRGPPVTFWCHVVIVVGLLQMPVYDMMPVPLHLIFIAAALGLREAEGAAEDAAEADRETARRAAETTDTTAIA